MVRTNLQKDREKVKSRDERKTRQQWRSGTKRRFQEGENGGYRTTTIIAAE